MGISCCSDWSEWSTHLLSVQLALAASQRPAASQPASQQPNRSAGASGVEEGRATSNEQRAYGGYEKINGLACGHWNPGNALSSIRPKCGDVQLSAWVPCIEQAPSGVPERPLTTTIFARSRSPQSDHLLALPLKDALIA